MRQFGGARGPLAVLVVAVALVGAALLFATSQAPAPVATSPSPTATASPTATRPSPTPTPTPTAPTAQLRVYFARDELPPVGASVAAPLGHGTSADGRIWARFDALASADAPSGAMNVVKTLRTRPTVRQVTIAGDQATVDWSVPNGDWGIGGSAATQALIRQMVYTATEEQGVRSVLFTENGGRPTIIDGVQVDHATTREDVFGYAKPGAKELTVDGPPVTGTVSTSTSVDAVALAMTRFVVTATGGPTVPPGFSVSVVPATDLGGTWEMDVAVKGVAAPYRLPLEDLRPWRAMVLYGPTRIVIDVGGPPRSVSDDANTAVYAPAPGATVSRTFHLTGAVRAFEATYLWRVTGTSGQVLAAGHGLASIGTNVLWGAAETDVTLPATASGNVTLDVYQVSPKDGAVVSLASVPLEVKP